MTIMTRRESDSRRVFLCDWVGMFRCGKYGAWLVVLAGVFGVWLQGCSTPAEPVPKPTSSGVTLRVLTCNIRYPSSKDVDDAWPLRREQLVETLLKPGPDILGMQEVTPGQANYLDIKLTTAGYTAAQAPPQTTQRTGFMTALGEDLLQLYFRTQRFELLKTEGGMLRPDQWRLNITENAFYKLAVLRDKSVGQNYIVVVTHLRHQPTRAEADALDLLARITQQHKEYPGASVFVMGDFNHTKGSAIYTRMTGGQPLLRDVFTAPTATLEPVMGTYHAFTGRPQGKWPIDLVFASDDWTVSAAKIIRDHNPAGRYPSDHFPVLADFTRAAGR